MIDEKERLDIMEIDKELMTNIYDLRRRLHSIPEASMHEMQTKAVLMSFLRENTDLEIVDRGMWFYAVLKSSDDRIGDEERPPIAFRADMDAVCGQDGKPGHYCGHDGHSSILCGTAVWLSHAMEKCGNTHRDVYFIFQPGEEIGAGARLCRDLIIEKNIGEIYGLHNIPGYPRNHVLTIDGTFACASTGLEIHMTGTASHAAYPEAGKNRELRDVFGMVLQDTWLFKGTIMENIRYGRLDATDEEVIAAAKAAHAHRFISALPGGYNMELNEEITNISQGQKQLLTIARAILADNPVLILDEATSSVDTRTEHRIQKAMDNLMKGRTSFVIAHRLSTIKNADIILVMKDGDIIEQGNHDELMAQNGFYADLYNSQWS